ncbi:MAG: STAS domain-containing protein [Litorivicinus sp.]
MIQASGVYDIDNYEAFRTELLAALKEQGRVRVDLSAVTFMDSSGLSCLVEALQVAQRDGRELILQNPSSKVTELLDLSALSALFTIEVVKVNAAAPAAGELGFDEPDVSVGEDWGGDLDLDDLSFDLDGDLNDWQIGEADAPAALHPMDGIEPDILSASKPEPQSSSPTESTSAVLPKSDVQRGDFPAPVTPVTATDRSSKNNLNLQESPAIDLSEGGPLEDYDDDPLNRL